MQGLLSNELLSKSSLFGSSGGSNIKNIQSFDIELTKCIQDIPINPIDLSCAVVIPTIYVQSPSTSSSDCVLCKIVDSTTIELQCNTVSAKYVHVDIIEFNNVKSIQTGIALPTSTESLIAVNPVNKSKSQLFCSWFSHSQDRFVSMKYFIKDSTHISLQTNGTVQTDTYWQLIEFN